MKIAVVGTGYVGLVTGVVLAHIGHNVTCVDVDENKIKLMRKGISPIYEKNLEELMLKNKERLIYTTDYRFAYKDVDVIFIGVGTPERADGSANLDYLYSALDQISESLEKDCVIVVKSTVPIGTNDKVEKYLKNHVKSGLNVYIVSNPEFLSQGTAVRDMLYASRIVVGIEDETAKHIMKKVYEPLTEEPYNIPYISMNRKSAEMVKYASNDFLALKISYINEIANFCEKVGANIEDVTKGIGCDPRIGNKFLRAGIGYGGSCFPKDTKALHWLSRELESELKTVKACIEVNRFQKIKMYEKLRNNFKSLRNLNIAVLGLTFKPGTDDMREAPSIENIELLLDAGANVHIYDPIGIDKFKTIINKKVGDDRITSAISYFNNIDDAIKDCDAVMIMTEWPQIVNYNIEKYVNLMKTPNVYDGRNCYTLEEIKNYKIYYNSIGRDVINNLENKEKNDNCLLQR